MTIEEIKRMVAGEQYSFLRTNPQIIGGTTKFSNEEIVVKQFMSYERLLKIAKKMHTWIFLHCFDEEEVYESLGITEDENAILGYGG